jgi:hypothetical protein
MVLKDSNIIPLVLDIFIVFEYVFEDDLFNFIFFKRGSAIFLSGKNRRTKQLRAKRVTYEIEVANIVVQRN